MQHICDVKCLEVEGTENAFLCVQARRLSQCILFIIQVESSAHNYGSV